MAANQVLVVHAGGGYLGCPVRDLVAWHRKDQLDTNLGRGRWMIDLLGC